MRLPPDVVTIDSFLPHDLLEAAQRSIRSMSSYQLSEYRHPFEPKLQVRKELHSSYPLKDILERLRTAGAICFFSELFCLPSLIPSDYFTAFYIYRENDFLQTHIDAAINDGLRKVVTANLYLTDCEGGELIIGERTIPVKANTLVLFSNHDESYHGVNLVTGGRRVMLTAGYCLPASDFPRPGFTRMNRKAWFVPSPGAKWTPAQYMLRNQRAADDWGKNAAH
jgi:hypothetical protein